ncbi:MAG: M23 family metallopeptidase [Bacteroidales bacterium]|nr:M23 family metallopeptidase [Bacteroidales bacterium]
MSIKPEKKRRKLFHKLIHKYRMVLLNEDTFEEVGYLRLTRLNLIAAVGVVLIFLVAIVYVLIAYTSIREFIPGYPDAAMRQNIRQNAMKLDSLEYEQAIRDQYFDNLKRIITGEMPENYMNDTTGLVNQQEITFLRSTNDSLLRQQVEEEEQFRLSVLDGDQVNRHLYEMHFFTPVNGIITRSFNPMEGHYGIDLVAAPNEVVKAALDGTVTISTWTLETGWVIQIQHDFELMSVYKHNATLFKSVGQKVAAGDAIAIVGNSGELTTGPHLHFELWHDRAPLNPVEYIVF